MSTRETTNTKQGGAFLVRTLVTGVVVGGAAFVGMKLASADPGGPVSPDALTFAGVLRTSSGAPFTGTTTLTFVFHKAGSTASACSPDPSVMVTIPTSANGAFTAQIPMDPARCPRSLFDGSTVTYDVLLAGESAPVAIGVPVTPVPYARFADQSGVANAARRPGPYGLTLAYDAAPTSPTYGQLCVQCDNRPCSETNPGFVAFEGPSPGQLIVDRFASTACVRDAHATSSDLAGHPFGTTTGVAWGEDRPFALYACRSASGPLIGVTPDPTKVVTPDAPLLATPRVPGTSQSDATLLVWSGTAEPGSPCVLLGSIRMRKNASDGWNVQPLDYGDGVDRYANFNGRMFTMPPGQFGTTPGQYLIYDRRVGVADTLPTYTTNLYTYTIGLDGHVKASFAFNNTAGGTPGGGPSGAALLLVRPYSGAAPSGLSGLIGTAYLNNRDSPDATAVFEHLVSIGGAGTTLAFPYDDSIGVNLVRGAQQSRGTREFNGNFSYWAFRVR